MIITKHQHACLTIEEQGQKLIIDPGVFTKDLGAVSDVAAVVITHVHADHFDPTLLASIVAANPDVIIYTTDEVKGQIASLNTRAVRGGQEIVAGPFTLKFYGGEHALIHPHIPRNQNVGVLVNGSFYYPGDSFTVADDAEVHTLALPVSAPWLKIAESMDFLTTTKPRVCFPTHNAILSPEGQGIVDRLIGNTCQENGITYTALQPGNSVEI